MGKPWSHSLYISTFDSLLWGIMPISRILLEKTN